MQIAPFTSGYLWPNTTPHVELSPDWTIRQNQWRGSICTCRREHLSHATFRVGELTMRRARVHADQESISHEVMADNTSFGGRGYTSYGFEVRFLHFGLRRLTWELTCSAFRSTTLAPMARSAGR